MNPVLRVRRMSVHFGGVAALDGFDLEVHPGEIVAIVGGNGAGKSTLLNAICGVVRRSADVLELDGVDLRAVRPAAVATLGVGRTFQHPRLLQRQTVLANLVLAGVVREFGMARRLLGYRRSRRAEDNVRGRAEMLSESLGLRDDLARTAGSIAYGVQKKVEIARALMTQPRLLLLDEPSSGLDPEEAMGLAHELPTILANETTSLVLVEHNLRLVRSVAQRVVVLETGRLTQEGGVVEVMDSDAFVAALQGTGTADPMPFQDPGEL
jgi:branched-chain amino acid transport system ATP-binding protein